MKLNCHTSCASNWNEFPWGMEIFFLSRIWNIARTVFGMYSNINLSFTKPLISTIRRPNQYQALINYNIEIDHILFMTIYHRWIINTHWYNYVHKNDTQTHTHTMKIEWLILINYGIDRFSTVLHWKLYWMSDYPSYDCFSSRGF